MNQRLDQFERSIGGRLDSFEARVGKDVREMKDACACKSRSCDGEFQAIHEALDGAEGQPGLKERMGTAEGTLRWQWIAIGAAYAVAAIIQSQLWAYVAKMTIIGG